MKHALLLAALLAFNAIAQDAEWVEVTVGKNGNRYSVNGARTKVVSTSIVETWLRTDMKSPRQSSKGPIMRSVDKIRLDCSKETMQYLSMNAYDANGAIVISINEPDTPDPVVPGSVGDGILTAVCPLTKSK